MRRVERAGGKIQPGVLDLRFRGKRGAASTDPMDLMGERTRPLRPFGPSSLCRATWPGQTPGWQQPATVPPTRRSPSTQCSCWPGWRVRCWTARSTRRRPPSNGKGASRSGGIAFARRRGDSPAKNLGTEIGHYSLCPAPPARSRPDPPPPSIHEHHGQSQQGPLGQGRLHPHRREHARERGGLRRETAHHEGPQGPRSRLRRRHDGPAGRKTRGQRSRRRHRAEPGGGREPARPGTGPGQSHFPGGRCLQPAAAARQVV